MQLTSIEVAPVDPVWRPLTVLVVEDSELDRRVYHRALTREQPLDFHVISAASLSETRAALAVSDGVDVMLVDLQLPDSQGLETVDALRELRPDLPIVVLTGNEDDELGIAAIGLGAQDYLFKTEVTPRSLARAIRYASERSRLLTEIKEMALRDPLTGIYNRRYFFDRGTSDFKTARRYGHPLAVMMIDGDNFKRVNDTYGHQAGDEVLKTVASNLREIARETDLVARYGGEEFAALLPQTPLDGAALLAERMKTAIADTPILTSAGEIGFSLSIGVAPADRDMHSLDDLVRAADAMLLYQAKENGRNRVEVYG